jgi:hypothetical protein
MSTDIKFSKAPNELETLATRAGPQPIPYSANPLAGGSPELRVIGGSTIADSTSSTGITFDHSPDEPPPAYEAYSAPSPQISPPQASPSQVDDSSSPIQIPPTTPKAIQNPSYETSDSYSAQENNGTQVYNL